MEWERVLTPERLRPWQDVTEAAYDADYALMPADPFEDALPVLENDGVGDSKRVELWLLSDGPDAVAAAGLNLPERDNLDEAYVELHVHPSRRRRGHGRTALVAAMDRCRQLGRSRLRADVVARLDGTLTAGEQLARSLGFAPVLGDVRRVLELDRADPVDGLRAEAERHAVDYRLETFVDRAPAAVVGGLAALAGRMSIDPPQGESAHRPEEWDAARWRAREDDALARGRLRVGAYAVRAGEVVAYTDIGVHRLRPEPAYQWDTIVRADHRGHRLGLLLKIVNLELLRAESPRTRWISTWNAASNEHMIAINEALGFRPVDVWTAYERSL